MHHVDKEHSVIYILGSSRGGATKTGRIFGLMPDTTFGGELRRLWGPSQQPDRLCGCGKRHGDCEIWSKLLVDGATYLQPSIAEVERLQERAAPVSHSWWFARKILRLASPPSATSPEGRYLTILSELYAAFARATGSPVVVDSSKNLGDAALLAFAPTMETYFVHVVRDPRSVLVARRRLAGLEPRRSRPLDAMRTTMYWMLVHVAAEAIRSRYGETRSLFVRYEDFVNDPTRTLEAASRLVGLSGPEIQLRADVPIEVPVAHGPDGHGRFATTEIVLTRDERWDEQLPPIDKFVVKIVAYPLLRRYGYTARTREDSAPLKK